MFFGQNQRLFARVRKTNDFFCVFHTTTFCTFFVLRCHFIIKHFAFVLHNNNDKTKHHFIAKTRTKSNNNNQQNTMNKRKETDNLQTERQKQKKIARTHQSTEQTKVYLQYSHLHLFPLNYSIKYLI